MRAHQFFRPLRASLVVVWVVLSLGGVAPVANAVTCPDVEVIFARGTGETPGVGWVGSTFINKLRSKLPGKSMSVYPVNYPAGNNFAESASVGAADANTHIQSMTVICPQTRLVLGGMSQGAGVIDLITIGNRMIWFFKTAPLPTKVADHVAAVVVFGNPSRDMWMLGPLTKISAEYGAKTIDLCANGDPYCSTGNNWFAHFSYPWNGMAAEGAAFAANQVLGRAN